MKFNHAVPGHRAAAPWLIRAVRIACMIALGCAALLFTVENRMILRAGEAAALNSAPDSHGSDGSLTSGNQLLAADAWLPSERDNNPFLLLLAQRDDVGGRPRLDFAAAPSARRAGRLAGQCPPRHLCRARPAHLLC